MPTYKPITPGTRFGKLTVVTPHACGDSQTECQCDCGNVVKVRYSNLRNGSTKSCGCLIVEASRNAHITHGHASFPHNRTGTYQTWVRMRARCNNPKHNDWKYYGGRGIMVCERWEKFEFFLEDMGAKPKNLSIDRIDNDGHYEPSNCRWADVKTQRRNRSNSRFLTFDGKTLCIAEWAEVLGLKAHTIYNRINRGLSVEKALSRE